MVAMAELKTVLPEAHVHVDDFDLQVDGIKEVNKIEVKKPDGKPIFGLLAQYETPEAILKAAHFIRRARFKNWDAHTPFPVHGLEKAMAIRRSWVPWIVLVMALGGAAAGMLLQWWVSTTAYPLMISGKPLFSWPAFVPIMFECGVLGGGLGAMLGFLIFSKLPEHYHPLFSAKSFEKMSDDKFYISIEAKDPKFKDDETADLLVRSGASHVEFVEA